MKTFTYTINDELGIHARPAGMLVKTAKQFSSNVMIKKADGTPIDVTRMMAVMGLGVKRGDIVEISAEGEDEMQAVEALEEFFQINL
ncbi:MAG: HPr family phosphocarrier protein [Hespellia sp.]|nr:HPr family phosphocarrier protein [Hespellia sp.]